MPRLASILYFGITIDKKVMSLVFRGWPSRTGDLDTDMAQEAHSIPDRHMDRVKILAALFPELDITTLEDD
jgi:hypothetical protein